MANPGNSIEEAGLLKNIADNPDDYSTPLIYADWLEEKGECERAQFIRLQSQLSLHPYNREKSMQAEEILQNNIHRWIAQWCGGISERLCSLLYKTLSWKYKQGFPEEIRGISAKSIPDCQGVFQHNVIDSLKPSYATSENIAEFDRLGATGLQTVRGLDLTVNGVNGNKNQGPSIVTAMTSTCVFENIKSLTLDGQEIGDEGLCILSRENVLPQLSTLKVVSNNITTAGLTELVQSPLYARLTHLDLNSNSAIDDEGVSLLINEHRCAFLKILKIYNDTITSKGARELLDAMEKFPQLKIDFSTVLLSKKERKRYFTLRDTPTQ